MKRGLRFTERMSGTFTPRSGAAGRFTFDAEAHAESALDYLRHGHAELSGTLHAEGLADGVPLSGTVVMQPLTRRRVRYDFNFTGNDGNPYRFSGEKQIRWRDPLRSFTRLPGAVYDSAGREVATCMVRFDLKADFLPFVASWRPA